MPSETTSKCAEPPSQLYKYRTAKTAIQIINDQTVRFATARTFNDPFEMSPVFGGTTSREIFRQYTLGRAKVENYATFRHLRPDLPPNEFVHWFKSVGVDGIYDKTDHDLERVQAERAYQRSVDALYVYCLSEPENDILMWAHYADYHKGMVVGFNTTAWDTDEVIIGKVRYTEVRPRITMDEILNLSTRHQTLLPTLITKSPHWAYEIEHRIIANPGKPSTANAECYKTFDIRPEQISTITFGAHCADSDANEIIAAVEKKGWTHVRFRKAVLSKERYEIITDYI